MKYFREKESMSQKELADALGMQPTSISRCKRGTSSFRLIRQRRLQIQIGISKKTVNKVKMKSGIKSYKVKSKWYWSLPQDGCVPDGAEAGDGRQD